MSNSKAVLSLLSHPDDSEFMSVGTLALLRGKGWDIHIATMTPGDAGSVEYSREEISKIRRGESGRAAKILDGTYHCLECDDLFITYDRVTLLKAIELVRRVRPRLVFAPSPCDYMLDHEITSQIVQAACFAAGVANVETPGVAAYESVPYLYYADALESKDKFGVIIEPTTLVDITSVMETKEKMLCCHESQRNWLMAHHGMDEYVISMKRFAEDRGGKINCRFAEGFRQHLGHAYPQDNILQAELDELVHII